MSCRWHNLYTYNKNGNSKILYSQMILCGNIKGCLWYYFVIFFLFSFYLDLDIIYSYFLCQKKYRYFGYTWSIIYNSYYLRKNGNEFFL